MTAPIGEDLPQPEPALRIPRVSVTDIFTSPSPEPDFVWAGRIPRGHVCLLSGHGGTGKSTLAIQLSLAVATGQPLFGVPTTGGPVIFFSGEDSAPLLRVRIAAVCRAMGINPATLENRLLVLDATEMPALGMPFRDRETGAISISGTAVYNRLRELSDEMQPVLIVTDNASDVFEGNENVRAEVRQFMRSLGVLGRQIESRPAVLLPTHTPKQSIKGEGESYSGSTGWHNSARSRLSLTPDKNDTAIIVLTLDKLNVAARIAEPLRLVRSHGGVLRLDEGAAGTTDGGLDFELPEFSVLRLLADFNRRDEKVSVEQTARNNAWKLLHPEQGFPKRHYKTGGQLFAAIRQMERAGLIERSTYTNAHRKRYEQWLLSTKGWGSINESAPTAPTAPTYGVDAVDAVRTGVRPPRPPMGLGGMGERSAHNVGAKTDNSPLAENTAAAEISEVGAKPEPDNSHLAESGQPDTVENYEDF